METFKNHTFAICAYKESEYLEECIKSLLKQTIESNIIITTSTPNRFIQDIANKYNINLYINTGKSGIGEDWNFAVSQCSTDYVTIAHQDDIYESTYLEQIEKYIKKYKDVVIAFTKYKEIKNGTIIPLTKNLKIKEFMLLPFKIFKGSKFVKRFVLSFGNFICCPSVTLNTKILGHNPYKTELKCNLDWDSWVDFTQYKGKYVYISKYLMCHRIHESSETSSLIENNIRLEEDLYMFKKFWPTWIADFLCSKYKNAVKSNKI
ncbi:MAG: glycosyltransferase family 2 protein [Clostridia bacterium]|nr:glycosyltransferase family 2 protein [Clostridia bacterium]